MQVTLVILFSRAALVVLRRFTRSLLGRLNRLFEATLAFSTTPFSGFAPDEPQWCVGCRLHKASPPNTPRISRERQEVRVCLPGLPTVHATYVRIEADPVEFTPSAIAPSYPG
jgi:hypothetical protein